MSRHRSRLTLKPLRKIVLYRRLSVMFRFSKSRILSSVAGCFELAGFGDGNHRIDSVRLVARGAADVLHDGEGTTREMPNSPSTSTSQICVRSRHPRLRC